VKGNKYPFKKTFRLFPEKEVLVAYSLALLHNVPGEVVCFTFVSKSNYATTIKVLYTRRGARLLDLTPP
jgi:hypothetical protein